MRVNTKKFVEEGKIVILSSVILKRILFFHELKNKLIPQRACLKNTEIILVVLCFE